MTRGETEQPQEGGEGVKRIAVTSEHVQAARLYVQLTERLDQTVNPLIRQLADVHLREDDTHEPEIAHEVAREDVDIARGIMSSLPPYLANADHFVPNRFRRIASTWLHDDPPSAEIFHAPPPTKPLSLREKITKGVKKLVTRKAPEFYLGQ